MRLCLLDIWYKGNLGSFSISTKWLSLLKAAGDLFRAGDISFLSGHPLVAWIEINCQCGGTEGMLCNV